ELARFAVDSAHRIRGFALRTADRALDRRIQPAFRATTVGDALRKFELGVDEREDRVVAFHPLFEGLAFELERGLRLAGRGRDIEDALRPRFEAQVFVASGHARLDRLADA